VKCRVGEWMIFACMVPTVKHWGGGVMVWRVETSTRTGETDQGMTGCLLRKIKNIKHFFGYFHVLSPSFDVFTTILQHRK
jgi:hypothetical protein